MTHSPTCGPAADLLQSDAPFEPSSLVLGDTPFFGGRGTLGICTRVSGAISTSEHPPVRPVNHVCSGCTDKKVVET